MDKGKSKRSMRNSLNTNQKKIQANHQNNFKRTPTTSYQNHLSSQIIHESIEEANQKIFESFNDDEKDDFFMDEDENMNDTSNNQNSSETPQIVDKSSSVTQEQEEFFKSHNISGFKPYFQLKYSSSTPNIIGLMKSKERFGKRFATPPQTLQMTLDPSGWEENPNFLPIPSQKNKWLKLNPSEFQNSKKHNL